MKKQRVFFGSFGESSTIKGVLQPISEINRTYTHGKGMDNPLSFRYEHYQDSNAIENTSYFYGKNHKDIVLITDPSGQIAEDYEYEPWGNGASGEINNVMYAERPFDDDINLYYNRHRYYDPITGRFTQKDKKINIYYVNRYNYISDSPINFADPYGSELPIHISWFGSFVICLTNVSNNCYIECEFNMYSLCNEQCNAWGFSGIFAIPCRLACWCVVQTGCGWRCDCIVF